MIAMAEQDMGNPRNWKLTSPSARGFHTVVSPQSTGCREAWIFRLNLPAGEATVLRNDTLEMSAVVVSGRMVAREGRG